MGQLLTASARHKHVRSFPLIDAGVSRTARPFAKDTDMVSTQR